MKQTILLFALMAVSAIGKSQSAVYFCTNTGAYGFAYNYTTQYAAEDAAYDICKEYGGTNCVRVASTSNSGYGVIAIGTKTDGTRTIGCAIGYDDIIKAKELSYDYASDYDNVEEVMYDFWYDSY